MKREGSLVWLFIPIIFFLGACSPKETGPEIIDGKELLPDFKGHTLQVYMGDWPHSEVVIRKFEEKFQVKVIIVNYLREDKSNPNGLAQKGSSDVLLLRENELSTLVKAGGIRVIDSIKLPSIRHLDSQFDFYKTQDVRYGVPYLWMIMGVLYKTGSFLKPLESWKDLFSQNHGKIFLSDSMRDVFAMGAKVLGFSVNTVNPDEVHAINEYLKENKKRVAGFGDHFNAETFELNNILALQGYSGPLAQLARLSKGRLKFIVPKEGSIISILSFAINKNTNNHLLAHAFIEFMLDPEMAAQTTNDTGYATANISAKKSIELDLINDTGLFPPPEIMEKSALLEDLGPYNNGHERAWIDFKSK